MPHRPGDGRPPGLGSRAGHALPLRLLAAGCCLLLAGSAAAPPGGGHSPSAAGQPPPRRGGTLTLALVAPRTLDPAAARTPAERILAANLFQPLTTVDADGSAHPAAAASWSSDPVFTRWTFRLRPDARFADGRPVRAADFAFAWARLARRGRQPPGRIRPLDPATLQVDLAGPDADLPAELASPTLAPLPSALVSADPAGFFRRPVGNGPFRLAAPWPGRGPLELVPSPAATGPGPYLARVRVDALPDEQTAWLELQDGLASFAPVPLDQLDAARAVYGTAADGRSQPGVLLGPAAATWDLALDSATRPFGDPRGRLAVSLALDRPRLAAALAGAAAPASGLAPAGLPGAGQVACGPCAHDPARARALLAQLPPARGPLPLAVPDDPLERRLADLVAADLAAVGLKVTVRLGPAAAPLAATGWSGAAPTLRAYLTARFGRGAGGAGRLAADPAAGLLARAAATGDPAGRRRLAVQAEAALLGQLPVVPVLALRHAAVLLPGVRGFDLTPAGTVDLAAVSLDR